jgi:hypothetical protein
MEIVHGIGRVISVDPNYKDAQGNVTPVVNIESIEEGGTFPIPLAAAAWNQVQPIPGYKVLYVRYGRHFSRIVAMWGNNEDFIRKGDSGLDVGDVVYQSPTGLCYLRLAASGEVQLVSGDMDSVFGHDDKGSYVKAPNITLQTYANTLVKLDEEGNITLSRVDSDGNPTASVVLDKDNNLKAVVDGDITLKGKNIFLDGNVSFGPGASDPSKRDSFGQVVTSGPGGTLPSDLVSGSPIPGSLSVKAAS